jgi:diguanylate cyclase (GGDEF)-like protein
MPHLIESVADLTARSDRDELEVTLASVTANLLQATGLVLWRLVSHAGELRLQERVRLTDGGIAVSSPCSEASDMPPLASRPELRACHDEGKSLDLIPDATGRHGHVFPVASARGVVGLMEIYYPTRMQEDQHKLVSGLFSIYRNHLRILDYSEYDELTGLLNRKTFDGSLAQLVRAEASGHDDASRIERARPRPSFPDGLSAWLGVLDIDFFKRINDRFGHLYGDEVLILVARLMRNCFGDADRLFRCGGEEFVIVLAPTTAELAHDAFERFRQTIEDFNFPQVGRVTVSLGYTCVCAGDNGLTAFGRADEALYTAKRQGRNRILCYEALIRGGVLSAKTLVGADVELF